MTTRLLLVDDHRMMREGLRSLLEAHDSFDVIGEADNGRDAVKMTEELKPDVVVMDLGMKDLNGIEATRQIRTAFPRVAVVVLSTYAQEDYVLSALEAGAWAYVLKISAHEELLEAIESVARGRRFLSPEITALVVDAGVEAQIARDPENPRLSGREQEVSASTWPRGRSSSTAGGSWRSSTCTAWPSSPSTRSARGSSRSSADRRLALLGMSFPRVEIRADGFRCAIA
jgi:DNA-binding NarL/FixJ family response regulator